MGLDLTVRWQDWSREGLEHLHLEETPGGIIARSVLIGGRGSTGFAAHYAVELDKAWRFRKLEAEAIGTGAKLTLESDGHGHWWNGFGETLPGLAEAVDIDLSASPFTNTLPIRRLCLEEGESADIVTAYVSFPELTVMPDPQRYTCLKRRALYRYASLDSDFTRDVEVDGDGLVVTYPGLFRRAE